MLVSLLFFIYSPIFSSLYLSSLPLPLQVSRIVAGEELALGGWEDGLMWNTSLPYDSLSTGETYAYTWNNIWEWGGGSRAYVLANRDYKVRINMLCRELKN